MSINNVVSFQKYSECKKNKLSFKSKPDNALFFNDLKKTTNIAMSWSGGKDSAYALYQALKNPLIKIKSLFTIFSGTTKRVSLSGLSENLMDAQVGSLKKPIPYKKYFVKNEGTMEGYNETLKEIVDDYKKEGINTILYGNTVHSPQIFEDSSRYITQRLTLFKDWGMNVLFPFAQSEESLQKEIVKAGFKSKVAYKSQELPNSILGRTIDDNLMKEIPAIFEGEPLPYNKFARNTHTFTYGGHIFKKDMNITTGVKISTQHGDYIDIIPDNEITMRKTAI